MTATPRYVQIPETKGLWFCRRHGSVSQVDPHRCAHAVILGVMGEKVDACRMDPVTITVDESRLGVEESPFGVGGDDS